MKETMTDSIMMLKMTLTTVAGSASLFLAKVGAMVDTPVGSVLQFGALGILALCAVYLVAKIIPESMAQRRNEAKEMLDALVGEREKLVQSMDALVDRHSKELVEAKAKSEQLIKEFHDEAIVERREWAIITRDSIRVQTEVHGTLLKLSEALSKLEDARK